MSTTERCDEIIRLIEKVLWENAMLFFPLTPAPVIDGRVR